MVRTPFLVLAMRSNDKGKGYAMSTSATPANSTSGVHPEWRDEDADLTDDQTQIPVDDRYEEMADVRDRTSVAPSVDPSAHNPAGADHAAEY